MEEYQAIFKVGLVVVLVLIMVWAARRGMKQ
jgi:hypothetical protein